MDDLYSDRTRPPGPPPMRAEDWAVYIACAVATAAMLLLILVEKGHVSPDQLRTVIIASLGFVAGVVTAVLIRALSRGRP